MSKLSTISAKERPWFAERNRSFLNLNQPPIRPCMEQRPAKNRPLSRKGNRGFSLIEATVAAAILMTVSLAIAAVIVNLNREVRSLDEKLVSRETETLVQRVTSNLPFCNCLFTGHQFDRTSNNWLSFPTSIPSSFAAACAPGPDSILSVGAPIGSSHLSPQSLSMVNITELTAGSGVYVGELSVDFDSTRLVRSVRPLRVPLTFSVSTTDPPNNAGFLACGNAAGSAILALSVPAGTGFAVPAGACREAIRVDMQMNAFRNDTPPGGYRGRRFEIRVNGLGNPQWQLEFGSTKGGATGHGWAYRANGLSKTFYLTNVANANVLSSALIGDPIVNITSAFYHVTCVN